jgi:Flp pilus assembly protein TadG
MESLMPEIRTDTSAPLTGLRRVRAEPRGGQAMVELALLMPIGLILLLIGIQFALLGQAALAVSQISFYGARYASVNRSSDQTAIKNQMISQGSPTITQDPTKLSVTMTCTPACTSPRPFGMQVTINVSYDAQRQLVLPNPFLGIITFPSTLTAQETAMSE